MTAELASSPLVTASTLNTDATAASKFSGGEESLQRIRKYAELSQLPLMQVDSATGVVLSKSHDDFLPALPVEVQKLLPQVNEVSVIELTSGLVYFILPLSNTKVSKEVAVGYVLSQPVDCPHQLVLAAAELNWPQERLDAWFNELPHCQPSLLKNLLASVVKQTESESVEADLQQEVDNLSDQIEQTYEEISLLHSVTSNLQISKSPVELAELCLSRLEELVICQGKAIWIDQGKNGTNFLVDGDFPFDEIGMARLISRFDNHDWSKPLVKNHIQGSLLGADYPGLKNFVIASIAEGSNRAGWIFCCNETNGLEFGTVEASLLNSIATILGTHLRNIDLYQQHDDLLLGFVRSLVSTLDAKDPYTRGHSERVALIARRIGQELNLPEEDLHDIYLSGLLHDIGKIGVNDQVLQKPGGLTDEEFKHIQQHPMIGYNILSELKNLQQILPGVRNHHENYNGKGYPDQLKGDEIPLMARIMGVADSYDAMGSDRPYRKGMPVESIEEIFRRGSGDQWDSAIIDVYFKIRDDIIQICDEYSLASGNLL